MQRELQCVTALMLLQMPCHRTSDPRAITTETEVGVMATGVINKGNHPRQLLTCHIKGVYESTMMVTGRALPDIW